MEWTRSFGYRVHSEHQSSVLCNRGQFIYRPACLWYAGGNWSIQRKPTWSQGGGANPTQTVLKVSVEPRAQFSTSCDTVLPSQVISSPICLRVQWSSHLKMSLIFNKLTWEYDATSFQRLKQVADKNLQPDYLFPFLQKYSITIHVYKCFFNSTGQTLQSGSGCSIHLT